MASIYPRGRTWWIIYYQDGKKVQTSLKTTDKRVANYRKNEIENQLAKGDSPLPDLNVSPTQVLAEYRRYAENRKSTKTLRDDIARIEAFFNYAHPSKLTSIKPQNVSEYITGLFKNKNISSPYTANHIIKNLKTLLNFAVKQRYLSENPLRYIDRYPQTTNPQTFYTMAEIDRIMDKTRAEDPEMYIYYALGFNMGGRPAELLTLEWSNINWSQRVISIINKPNFQTKSRIFRVVPLNKKLADILTPKRKKNGFCAFPERASGVATRSLYDIVLKRHRRLVAALELKESTPRITRSSFASNLVLKGVSVYKVSKWLGHASVKTTEKHYAHLAPKNDEDINRI